MDPTRLLEQMFSPGNLNAATKQVKRNKGCGGVDRLTITATLEKLRQLDNGSNFASLYWMEVTNRLPFWV